MFRFGQIVQQKFQHQRTAKAPALDLELRKAHGQVGAADVLHSDKAGVPHCFGKAVAFRRTGGRAAVLRAELAQVPAADVLVTAPPVGAAEPAALVAEKFQLVLLRLRQAVQLRKGFIQAEVRHHIAELRPGGLRFQLCKLREYLGGGGHQI